MPRSKVAGSQITRIDTAASEPVRLADLLRATTRELHTKAEQSGIIRDVLCGDANRYGYALLLRNLLPAYEAMERELMRRRQAPAFHVLAQPVVYRCSAIRSDLSALCGTEWREKLTLLPAGRLYADHIGSASREDPAALLGHVYTRYLGDLNGGQILYRRLAESLNLDDNTLAFYSYPMIDDLKSFKTQYRDAINKAGTLLCDTESPVQAAVTAFQHNIAVSIAVQLQSSLRKTS